MKITKARLKEIIKEEVQKILEAKHKDKEVSGVKVVEEEEELDEMSTAGGATASVEGAPVKEQ